MEMFDIVLDARSNFSNDQHDNEHFWNCWRIQDCRNCVSNSDSCGWCPYSATCVPLPKYGNVLSPVTNEHICPMPWQERWELRTAPFGCSCSTTSMLVAIITVASTLVALMLLAVLVLVMRWIRVAWKGNRGGWELHVEDDGRRWGHIWVRKEDSWPRRVWRRINRGKKEALEEERPLIE